MNNIAESPLGVIQTYATIIKASESKATKCFSKRKRGN